MTNPYSPPNVDEPIEPDVNRPFYRGGFLRIGLLGIGIGVAVGVTLVAAADWHWSFVVADYVVMFVAPAIGWVLAYGLLMLQVQRVQLKWRTMVLFTLLYSFVSYVLYVPVCAVTAGATMNVWGTRDHLPGPPGIIFGSTVAFLLLLLTFAAGIRANLKPKS